jgi:hypothetical protein
MSARVLRASRSEYETELSFAGLHQLLLPAAGSLPELPEVHRAALATALGFERGEPHRRLVLTSALLAWLRRLASTTPLVLVVDDLQWIDRASVVILSLVARRLGGLRVGLLLSQRTGQESFFDRESVPELTLMPLAGDSPPPANCLRIRHRSGGLPPAFDYAARGPRPREVGSPAAAPQSSSTHRLARRPRQRKNTADRPGGLPRPLGSARPTCPAPARGCPWPVNTALARSS